MVSHKCTQRLKFDNLNVEVNLLGQKHIISKMNLYIESDDSGVQSVSCVFISNKKKEFLLLELEDFKLAVKIMEQNAAPTSCINLVDMFIERWSNEL